MKIHTPLYSNLKIRIPLSYNILFDVVTQRDWRMVPTNSQAWCE